MHSTTTQHSASQSVSQSRELALVALAGFLGVPLGAALMVAGGPALVAAAGAMLVLTHACR